MEPLHCLVVGGGPAGLTAAIYLARYRCRFLVVDAGQPRAALIPTSHNLAGFADGIGGRDILARWRAHAERYGARIEAGTVTGLQRRPDGAFAARVLRPDGASAELAAATVLLAAGVVDVEPMLPNLADAIARGYVRHCPVCDAYEVRGRSVAVLGHGAQALGEALFLRHWTERVTLCSLGRPLVLRADDRRRMAAAGIAAVEAAVVGVACAGARLAELAFADGRRLAFDTVYSALGARVRSDLARSLGARADGNGALLVDAHQQTSVEGLYAAGDVVAGLNQIATAMGHAAIASLAIFRAVSPYVAGWEPAPELRAPDRDQ